MSGSFYRGFLSLAIFVVTLWLFTICSTRPAFACDGHQKGGDPAYVPLPFTPTLSARNPLLLYDESHFNYYTVTPPDGGFLEGKYKPFATLASQEGFTVITTTTGFHEAASLQGVDLVVIAGAVGGPRHFNDNGSWNASIGVPAFSEQEIAILAQFVRAGGNLFVAANHAPLTDPIRDLVRAFGVETRDSSVLNGLEIPVSSNHPIAQNVASFYTGGGGALFPILGATVVTYPPSVVAFAQSLPYSKGAMEVKFRYLSNLPNIHALDVALDAGFPGAGRVIIAAHAGDFTSQQEFCGTTQSGPPQDSLVRNQTLVLNMLRWLVHAL